jgi:hypothetical protein
MVKVKSREDMVVVIGDTRVFADGICALLGDDDVLVKRGALELLTTKVLPIVFLF